MELNGNLEMDFYKWKILKNDRKPERPKTKVQKINFLRIWKLIFLGEKIIEILKY